MLEARPNFLIMTWFDWYCRYTLRKFFHRVHLFENDSVFDPHVSTLYAANHVSFWDGIVLYHLIRQRRRQPVYCMIDETQIREHPFFRRVGGFSVDRGRPRDGMRAIRYAADLMNASPCAVVMFPQGSIQPAEKRPLGFESGVRRLVERVGRVNVTAVALRYEFWTEQRAELLIDLSRGDGELEKSVEAGLERLRGVSLEKREGEILLRGRRSISRWKEAWR